MATVFLALQQHQYMGQMSPQSPMYGSNSFGSSASTFHMSQSSGSPNLSYPYSHWYWPQPPSPPAAAPGVTPFMQAQYAPSNSFTSGKLITCMGEPSASGMVLLVWQLLSCQICMHMPNATACLLLLLT